MRFIRDLNVDTAKLLQRIYKHSVHPQVRQRAHCILLSYKGKTIPELISIFQVSRNTIYNWMNDWEDNRLIGLYNRTGQGRKPIFNEAQKQRMERKKFRNILVTILFSAIESYRNSLAIYEI